MQIKLVAIVDTSLTLSLLISVLCINIDNRINNT